MPIITDWIMVIVTGVYVFATIFICVFNYRSAKATREQVAEAKRQYEEKNRAYITYEFHCEKRAFYGIRFTNYGNRVANHVKIQIKEEFIDSITEMTFSSMIRQQNDKELILGIGQSYDIYFGKFSHKLHNIPFEGQLVYEDDKKSYCEPFFIDVGHYATIYSVKSETEELCDVLKEQTRILKRIKQVLETNNKNCDECVSTSCIDVQDNE